MGITIIQDTTRYGKTRAVMICNTTEKALSPVFSHKLMAEDFMAWLEVDDPRELEDKELEEKASEFREIYDPELFEIKD